MSEFFPSLGFIGQAVVVVLAFSVLVFVHELGHYLAARLTGVRGERFFIGFDTVGLASKIESLATVYGIGILPLGGYCALAGQNDDPRKEKQSDAPDELQNKPLWARGLVFGGGVLMNFLFGFLVLIAAYMHGIPFIPSVIGVMDPTGPAAVHGFQSGDRITMIDGKDVSSFEEVAEAIALAGAGGEVDVRLERKGEDGAPRTVNIRVKGRASSMRGNLNTIGAEPERSNIVGGIVDDPQFTTPLEGKLAVGDRIVAVDLDGQSIPVDNGRVIPYLILDKPGQDVLLTVSDRKGAEHQVAVPLETFGEWDMGLRIGVAVGGVVADSPAAKARLQAGDLIVAYQREEDAAPQRIASTNEFMDMVASAALRPVELNIRRDGAEIAVAVTPRLMAGSPDVDPETDTLLGVEGWMMGADGFRIDRVLADSPGEGQLLVGDYLYGINGKPLPAGKSLWEAVETEASEDIRLFVQRRAENDDLVGQTRRDLPDANLSLRLSPRISPEYRRPMIGIDLTAGPVTAVVPGSFADVSLGGINRLAGARLTAIQYSPDLATTSLRFAFPENSPQGGGMRTLSAPTPDYIKNEPLQAGLRARLPVSFKTAEEIRPLPFGAAVVAAGKKWVDLSLMVYRVIHRLIVRTLPLDAVGGPVQLFRMIKIADDRGFAYFLYIVALISVNLGVCNLLPFPVLDGGHLVFLLIEWLIGRPPPPIVRETAQWIGLVCLLALMLTVTGYDIMHLFKGTG